MSASVVKHVTPNVLVCLQWVAVDFAATGTQVTAVISLNSRHSLAQVRPPSLLRNRWPYFVPAKSVSGSALFAIGALLFVITLTLNIASHFIVKRFRELYE